MATCKKDRRETFSSEDRDLLIALLRERRAIGDASNTVSANAAKKKAWTEVAEAYNKASCLQRSETQLRDYIKRLKVAARKEYGDFKKQKNATGGGPPPDPLPEWILILEEIFPNLTKEMECPYDSDAAKPHQTEQPQNEGKILNSRFKILTVNLFI